MGSETGTANGNENATGKDTLNDRTADGSTTRDLNPK